MKIIMMSVQTGSYHSINLPGSKLPIELGVFHAVPHEC